MTLPDYGPPAHGPGCAVMDGPPGTRPCGATARWHIAWDRAQDGGLRTSLACEQHMGAVQTAFVYIGRHAVRDDCLRKGTRWQEGWCTAPDDAKALDEVEKSDPADAVRRLQSTMLFMLHPDLQSPDEEPTT